jgi:hypothetical protein
MDTPEKRKADALTSVRGFAFHIQDAIHHTPAEAVSRNRIVDRCARLLRQHSVGGHGCSHTVPTPSLSLFGSHDPLRVCLRLPVHVNLQPRWHLLAVAACFAPLPSVAFRRRAACPRIQVAEAQHRVRAGLHHAGRRCAAPHDPCPGPGRLHFARGADCLPSCMPCVACPVLHDVCPLADPVNCEVYR